MTSITVEMEAIPARRHELLQTLHDLAPLIYREQGILDVRIHMDANDRNRMTLVEEWETQETLAAYMESDLFHILRGALKVLTSFFEITMSPNKKPIRRNLV